VLELIEYLDTRKEVVGEYKLIVVVILPSVVQPGEIRLVVEHGLIV
jgi:hypothetical protein